MPKLIESYKASSTTINVFELGPHSYRVVFSVNGCIVNIPMKTQTMSKLVAERLVYCLNMDSIIGLRQSAQ